MKKAEIRDLAIYIVFMAAMMVALALAYNSVVPAYQ